MILMKYVLNKKNYFWFKNFRKLLKIVYINFFKKKNGEIIFLNFSIFMLIINCLMFI